MVLTALLFSLVTQQNPVGLVLPKTAKITDAVELSQPSQVQLDGLLGQRYESSWKNRLLVVDEDELLNGYRHKPGVHPWIGEHVGKWLHAASLVVAANHDDALSAKLVRVAKGLIGAQEPDGYLGTYTKDKRFGTFADADWDVWSHKYCLLGLLSYYQVTQDKAALTACRKAGDLLIRKFGPGGKPIILAGTHQGMAATSVLEPIALLYRATNDRRYLTFAKQIVAAYNQKGGPRIIDSLLKTGSVAKTSDAKAYELLSNLVGLCELYRVTGDATYLKPVHIAWKDVAAKRLYLTGTASSHELFTADGVFPDGEGDNVGETCVTVTWMQLNIQLLRLEGKSMYADEIERSIYNHLLASQTDDGSKWCYYDPLTGRRKPTNSTSCCLSSGPRGIALLPTVAYTSRQDGIDINFFGNSTYIGSMKLVQVSDYPASGESHIQVHVAAPEAKTVRVRIPAWVSNPTLRLNGVVIPSAKPGTYVALKKVWRTGDTIALQFPMQPRQVVGSGSNKGKVAWIAGPLVLAADGSVNKGFHSFRQVSVNTKASIKRAASDLFQVTGTRYTRHAKPVGPVKLNLVPFYAAGKNQQPYAVWLSTQAPVPSKSSSLFADGPEDISRVGNQNGSFCDGNIKTLSVTYDSSKAAEDWYAITIDEPTLISRVVYRHGASYHDGGWFDTTEAKPRIEVQMTPNGPWKTVGVLETYPKTDSQHMPAIAIGQPFECRFAPVKAIAVRVVGKPSSGDNALQAFSSCSELEAYAH